MSYIDKLFSKGIVIYDETLKQFLNDTRMSNEYKMNNLSNLFTVLLECEIQFKYNINLILDFLYQEDFLLNIKKGIVEFDDLPKLSTVMQGGMYQDSNTPNFEFKFTKEKQIKFYLLEFETFLKKTIDSTFQYMHDGELTTQSNFNLEKGNIDHYNKTY